MIAFVLANVANGTPASGAKSAADPPHLYVANLNSVTEYDEAVNGNVAPLATISGSSTAIDRPGGVAVDAAGGVFVSNTDTDLPGGARNPSVTGYPPGATGDRAPSTTIQGSNTFLSSPFGMTVDRGQNLFVVNAVSVNQDSVNEFAQAGTGNATGNVTPKTTIMGPNTGLNYPEDVALDPEGNVFVASLSNNAVTEYAPGANGDQAPKATISGPSTGLDGPIAVAVDSGGNVFVANYNSSTVTEYAKGANGNQTPAATIGGPHTEIDHPRALAVDAEENLFVAPNFGTPVITEYAPGANGDKAPMATIQGDKTGLNVPEGLAVPPFPSGTPPTKTPDAPTIGQAHGLMNHDGFVDFSPPKSDGRDPIVSYTAKATDLDNSAGTRTASGTGSPIHVGDLTNGDLYSFSVSAANILGSGPYSDQSNQIRPAALDGVQGKGTNDNPYVAECDDLNAEDCTVDSFPPTYLNGLSNDYVPAYKCPSSHPYLLDQSYAPGGTNIPNGVENTELENPWPIGISITGVSSTTVGDNQDVRTGTTTGGLDSSVTNFNTARKSYKIILHCTSNVKHGYNEHGGVL